MTSPGSSDPAATVPAFSAAPFAFRDLQEHGSIVGIDLGGIPTAVVYDLAAIHQMFADKLDHVGRAAVFDRLSHATGNGILTNYDWDSWHPRRKRIVRPLGARAVDRFHHRMVHIIDAYLDDWAPGDHPDLTDDVRGLTLRVVADLLFTIDLTTEAEQVIDRAVEIHAWAEADPANADTDTEPASFRAAIDELDALIREVIAGRPHQPRRRHGRRPDRGVQRARPATRCRRRTRRGHHLILRATRPS